MQLPPTLAGASFGEEDCIDNSMAKTMFTRLGYTGIPTTMMKYQYRVCNLKNLCSHLFVFFLKNKKMEICEHVIMCI